MSLAKLCILGALMERPMHGYELKQYFESSMGVFWMINYGSIYPTLRTLEAERMVKSRKVLSKTVGKIVYEITDEGKKEFLGLLKNTIKKEPHVRDEFTLHLFFLDYLKEEDVKELFKEKIQGNKKMLEHILKNEKCLRKVLSRFKLASVDRGIMHIKTEIDWLNKVMEDLK